MLKIETHTGKYGFLGQKLKKFTTPPRIVVIHTTEGSEKPGARKNVATWFDNKDCEANAHFIVDPQAVLQYVSKLHLSYHAGKANGHSYGIELCGKASQKDVQYECNDRECVPVDSWLDDNSKAVLANAALLCATTFSEIRPIKLTVKEAADIMTGGAGSGYIGHGEIEQSLKLIYPNTKLTRTDPGKLFPWNEFLQDIKNNIK